MSLQTDYRPRTFKTFVGNNDIIESLKQILNRPQSPAAFLFTGPAGTGKTTLARIVKNYLDCADADFVETNAADDRGIDGIRRIIESMKYAPLAGKCKIILMDEAHQLTRASQEALLKALEEPPSYVHFCICTTNPEMLKPTFKRRCHHYELKPLNTIQLNKLIKYVLKSEEVDCDQGVIDRIIELSDGSAGQALKLLDMVIDMDDPKKALSTLQSAGNSESDVISICRVLANRNISAQNKWTRIKKLLKGYRGDGESARRPILGYLSKVLLSTGDPQIALMMECFERNFFDSGNAGLILACYNAIFETEIGDE